MAPRDQTPPPLPAQLVGRPGTLIDRCARRVDLVRDSPNQAETLEEQAVRRDKAAIG